MPSTMDISALPWMNSNTRKKVPTTAALIKKSARVPRNAYSSEAFYVGLLETVRVFVSYVIQHKDSKPEAGLVTAAVLYILNSRPQGYLFKQVCLLPKSVVQDEQHYRLLTSCAVQLDSSQLTCSLATMMPHMLQSEASFGPTAAIMDVALVASMTSAMQVGASWVAKSVLSHPAPYHRLAALGLMPTALGLRMVHAFESAEPRERIFGLLPCPSRFMPWVSLLLAQAGVPAQSFLGNMCGMYAGMAYAVGVAPALKTLGVRRHTQPVRRGGRLQDLPAGWVPSTRRKPVLKLLFHLTVSGAVIAARGLLALPGSAGAARRAR